jgi:hypothetical protein
LVKAAISTVATRMSQTEDRAIDLKARIETLEALRMSDAMERNVLRNRIDALTRQNEELRRS